MRTHFVLACVFLTVFAVSVSEKPLPDSLKSTQTSKLAPSVIRGVRAAFLSADTINYRIAVMHFNSHDTLYFNRKTTFKRGAVPIVVSGLQPNEPLDCKYEVLITGKKMLLSVVARHALRRLAKAPSHPKRPTLH